jgi:hypothetical protein
MMIVEKIGNESLFPLPTSTPKIKIKFSTPKRKHDFYFW